MSELKSLILSPAWWVTSIFLAIFVNLISAYLKPHTDRFFSTVSKSAKTVKEAEKKFREDELSYLIANPAEQQFLAIQEIRCRLQAVFATITATTAGVLGYLIFEKHPIMGIFLLSMCILFQPFAMATHWQAIRLQKLLARARKSKYDEYI